MGWFWRSKAQQIAEWFEAKEYNGYCGRCGASAYSHVYSQQVNEPQVKCPGSLGIESFVKESDAQLALRKTRDLQSEIESLKGIVGSGTEILGWSLSNEVRRIRFLESELRADKKFVSEEIRALKNRLEALEAKRGKR